MSKSVYKEYKQLITQPELEEKLSIGSFTSTQSGKTLVNLAVHNGDRLSSVVSVDLGELKDFVNSFEN